MAKSPTPIPAPPVKIQRGAPTNTPVKKRRRKKRVNPFVLLLRGLARRIYFGVKTAFKFLLLVPILVFMVAFSYNVDRSGLFQGALAPRRIVDLMLQGYDVTNFEQMDERQVVQLFAQDVPETPEAIGIGSSRVLQFNRENTGVESFFNMGVTGADVRDNMTSYYKMVTYGKAPRVLLWSLDPVSYTHLKDPDKIEAVADRQTCCRQQPCGTVLCGKGGQRIQLGAEQHAKGIKREEGEHPHKHEWPVYQPAGCLLYTSPG